MPVFRFRFQRVLEVQTIKKDLAQAEASRRLQAVQAVQLRLENLQGTYKLTQEDLRDKLEAGIMEAGRLSGYSSYLFMLERSIRMTLIELDHTKAKHREALNAVVLARQEEMIYEKIRDRDKLVWKKDEENRAAQVLDEVGSMRHLRRLRSGDSA